MESVMQQNRWERLAPITGFVFVVITVAVFAIGGSTPEEHDSAQKVRDFYVRHHDKHTALAFVLAIGIPFLLFFASTLRTRLRAAGGTGQLAGAVLGGGVVAAVGFGLLAMFHLALASAADNANTLDTLHTLNVLDSNDYIPAASGLAIMLLAAGLSVLRHGGLPVALGWIAIVIGVLAFTPVGFFAFLAGGLWVAVVSLMLTLGSGSGRPAAT
jgi:hypothetical protein